ncbi:replicative DNA helicase [Acetilactobacillus jinshanensis]|uniref:Replicative DNA helicase n=1 Tax=Acetilactobacillus jinshanensis TaxID=1720083 RepID=A0A4P6ZJM1_9LACO|nr:replicative DNA helicase [Acetilactobacillus jinshanensis]QBP17612.1 replicative DNA helicase [Acetilactobacillus jinshanensis]URL61844.1 replicative DNA helicase [uncultured bacterium]
MNNDALIAKTPPHDNNAEQAVLGAVFLDNTTLADVMEYVKPSDFYAKAHQYIFAAMVDLSDRNQAIDAITMPDLLKAKHQLSAVGGYKYIAKLAESVPTAANVTYYAKIVRDKSISRRLIRAANEIAQDGYEQQGNVEEQLDNAESRILNVSQEQDTKGLTSIHDIINTAYTHINQLSKDRSDVTGLATGYPAIDKLTTGFHKGEFIIVAARPAMGKTTFALNVAQNVATTTGDTVAIFSLEMGAESLVDRMICAQGNIKANHLRTGQLSHDDWTNIVAAVGSLSKDNIYIDDTPGINISSILARSRRLAEEKKNLSLIVVDYLQLVEGNDKESRQQEVSEVSRQLKKLAKELNVPVLALSQLSRSVEQREDKRPVLSDIRESGSIEQDADIVSFLYRKDYYERDKDVGNPKNPNPKPKTGNDASDTEFIIEKNRSGPRGTVHLMFLKAYNKFSSIIAKPVNPPVNPNGKF